jgi:hypothetical protein
MRKRMGLERERNQKEELIKKQRDLTGNLVKTLMTHSKLENCNGLANSMLALLQWTLINQMCLEDRKDFIKKRMEEAEVIKSILNTIIDANE